MLIKVCLTDLRPIPVETVTKLGRHLGLARNLICTHHCHHPLQFQSHQSPLSTKSHLTVQHPSHRAPQLWPPPHAFSLTRPPTPLQPIRRHYCLGPPTAVRAVRTRAAQGPGRRAAGLSLTSSRQPAGVVGLRRQSFCSAPSPPCPRHRPTAQPPSPRQPSF